MFQFCVFLCIYFIFSHVWSSVNVSLFCVNKAETTRWTLCPLHQPQSWLIAAPTAMETSRNVQPHCEPSGLMWCDGTSWQAVFHSRHFSCDQRKVLAVWTFFLMPIYDPHFCGFGHDEAALKTAVIFCATSCIIFQMSHGCAPFRNISEVQMWCTTTLWRYLQRYLWE